MTVLKLCVFITNILFFTWALPMDLKIAGGDQGDISQHPWVVTIWSKDIPICSGFLIGARWVVTSAQCCIYNNQFIDGVRAGSNSSYDGGQYAKFQRFDTHPKARIIDTIPVNDVAILTLAEPVSGDNVGFIKLPGYREPIETGTKVTVTGMGLDQNGDMGTLRELTAPVLDEDLCAELVDLPFFHYAFTCAGNLNSDEVATACAADTGAPVEYNGTAVGFVSFVKPGVCDKTPGKPALFVKLAEYVDWIQEITGI